MSTRATAIGRHRRLPIWQAPLALASTEDGLVGLSTPDGRAVATSARWSALNAAVLKVSSFGVGVIVARLVSKSDIGVVTTALIVFTFAISVAELGVSAALVREPDRSPQIAPTVFSLSLVASVAITGLMLCFAGQIARLLHTPEAASSVRVLSLVVLLSGFSAVPAALMSRDFMQRQRFYGEAGFLVASTVVMLVLVLLGHPIMGLALSRVAGQLAIVVTIAWLAPERYWPGFDRSEAKRLLAFGLPLAAVGVVTIAVQNVDYVVIARDLGKRPLTLYSYAFNISGWPITIFSAVLISVTLPVLSRARNSPSALVRHLHAGLSAVTAASFPVCALFIGLAGPLLDTVYGPTWRAASTALIALSVLGAARTVLTLFSDLTIAIGLTKHLLVIQLVWLAALTPAMIFCVHRWGIAGAGVAHAMVVVLVVMPIYLVTVHRNTQVRLGWIAGTLARPLFASIVCGGLAYSCTLLLGDQLIQLLAGTLVGLLGYVAIAGRWLRSLIAELRALYWPA